MGVLAPWVIRRGVPEGEKVINSSRGYAGRSRSVNPKIDASHFLTIGDAIQNFLLPRGLANSVKDTLAPVW
jgi:hypothetical protein